MIAARIPLILITIPVVHRFLPASPRFLATNGKSAQAEKVFEQIWQLNKVKKLPGRLVRYCPSNVNRGRLFDHWLHPYLSSTILISILYSVEGALVVGGFFIGNELEDSCRLVVPLESSPTNASLSSSSSLCRMPSAGEIWIMFTTSLGQIPGTLIAMCLAKKIGRKCTMTVVYAIHSVAIVPLFFCAAMPLLNVTLMVLFSGTQASNSLLNLYSSEAYPTAFRNTANR